MPSQKDLERFIVDDAEFVVCSILVMMDRTAFDCSSPFLQGLSPARTTSSRLYSVAVGDTIICIWAMLEQSLITSEVRGSSLNSLPALRTTHELAGASSGSARSIADCHRKIHRTTRLTVSSFVSSRSSFSTQLSLTLMLSSVYYPIDRFIGQEKSVLKCATIGIKYLH